MIFLDINQDAHFLGDSIPLEILDLHAEMRRISDLDFIEEKRGNNTGIGYTLEYCLGIAENNFPGADFMYNGKSVELKARRNSSGSRVTLFTKTPIWDPLSAREIIEKYGYDDGKGRTALKNSLSTTHFISQGLRLEVTSSQVLILHENGARIAYFDNQELEEKFSSKFGENMLLVGADVRKEGNVEFFHYNNAVLYEGLLKHRFWEMLKNGDIVFDFRFDIRERNEGFHDYFVRDHGPGFRIQNGDISDLYESHEDIL